MPAMSPTDRQNAAKAQDVALRGALTHIEREFGKGTLMRMGDPGAQVRCEAIPTGALSLDLALGIGGVPRGRIVEVYGPESSGKTTLQATISAPPQRRSRIDHPGGFDASTGHHPRPSLLPTAGHRISPRTAIGSPHGRPSALPTARRQA
jgi:recA bacterial DNA recombination protein